MHTNLLKASVVLALLAILLGMPLLVSPHRVRPSRFQAIGVGMTLAEVEETMCAKPGHYDGYEPQYYGIRGVAIERWEDKHLWCSRYGWIEIFFDRQDRVIQLHTGWSQPETWWARLWHRLAPP